MGLDVDYANTAVAADLTKWGSWVLSTSGSTGFRLDAVKSLDADFTVSFVAAVRKSSGLATGLFIVAEYWDSDMTVIGAYLSKFAASGGIHTFDSALHYNLQAAGAAGASYDLRNIFAGSTVAAYPDNTVTLVDNHDTQPGQELSSFVAAAFKPIAYALILFREAGLRCVFAGDLYGMSDAAKTPAMANLSKYIKARKYFAYGTQTDYFNSGSTLGWARAGDEAHAGSAVVVNIATSAASVTTQLDASHAGETRKDALGNTAGSITIGTGGSASFGVQAESVSVWVNAAGEAYDDFNA